MKIHDLGLKVVIRSETLFIKNFSKFFPILNKLVFLPEIFRKRRSQKERYLFEFLKSLNISIKSHFLTLLFKNLNLWYPNEHNLQFYSGEGLKKECPIRKSSSLFNDFNPHLKEFRKKISKKHLKQVNSET